MSASEESLSLLRSIDATLKSLLALSQRRVASGPNGNGHAPAVANDSDLDGKYGDPVIKAADPRDWSGPTMKGRKFSECSAEYLDLYAQRCDYFAEKADAKGEMTTGGAPKSKFLRMDGARARGWAARIRAGKVKQAPTDAPSDEDWGLTDDGWK
jgi:hypothetical protein